MIAWMDRTFVLYVYLHSMEWRRIRTAFKRLRKSIFMYFYDFHQIMSDVFCRYIFSVFFFSLLFLYLFSIFFQFILVVSFLLLLLLLYVFNTALHFFQHSLSSLYISFPESNFIHFFFVFYVIYFFI